DGAVWVNEVNTIPGSLAFYLWEASGVPFRELCDRLISLAHERAAERRERLTTFSTALLAQAARAAGPKQRA
ncbi:MAG: D-alanine--D-alanine ligase, partial [Dehalococcoidia bacterium]|nr:D-alanine--D-alanine ligase [Dehalococcoidia bacterium]